MRSFWKTKLEIAMHVGIGPITESLFGHMAANDPITTYMRA